MIEHSLQTQNILDIPLISDDRKKVEGALIIFLERALRAKHNFGAFGSFIVGTNYKYNKSLIEEVLNKQKIEYDIVVNQYIKPFDTGVEKPEVFNTYEPLFERDLTDHITWSFHLRTGRSAHKNKYKRLIADLHKQYKTLEPSHLVPIVSLRSNCEDFEEMILNESNKCNFENASYLIESFLKVYEINLT